MASVFVIIEQVVRLLQHKELTRIQDLVTNLGSAVIFLFSRLLFLGMIIHVYIYIYENYRIVDLGPETIWSWLVSLLLVEFVYYWTHRALHEFNILWAAHQFHHMAEDLNVSTAVRDSVVDLILYDVSWIEKWKSVPLLDLLDVLVRSFHYLCLSSFIHKFW